MRVAVRYILILALLLAVGCGDKHKEVAQQPFDFSFAEGTPSVAHFEADGGSLTVQFNSFYNWVAQPSDEWIVVKPNSGTSATTEFVATITANPTKDERDGTITLHLSNGEQHSLSIHQLCSGFFDYGGEESYSVPREEAIIEIPFRSNIDYKVSPSDSWISVVDTRAIEEGNITLKVAENLYFAPRTGYVEILDSEGEVLHKLPIAQEAVYCRNNEILYLTNDNAAITLGNKAGFGSTFQSNTHNGTYGRIAFAGDINAIANNAFNGCSNLLTVIMPDRITAIGREAFKDCSGLTSIGLPKNLIHIGVQSFAGCTLLQNLDIPTKLLSIGESAFEGCENAGKITIESIESWLNISFGNESANPLYQRGYLCLNSNVGATLTDIVVPSSITKIKDYALCGYQQLSSLKLHSKIASIGKRALYGCTGELQLDCPISSSYTDGDNPFYGSQFTKIAINYPIFTIGDYTFADMKQLNEVTLPITVTHIGSGAFKGCSSLTDLEIPASVVSFGKAPFEGCGGKLTINCGIPECIYAEEHFLLGASFSEIVVGDSVTHIGRHGFYGYDKAKHFHLGSSVSAIGTEAFSGCTGEIVVTCSLPSSRVGTNGALYGSKFSRITLSPTVSSIGTNALYGCEGELIVECTIPYASTATASPFYGSKFSTITLLDVESINDYAFYGYDSLQSIVLPASLKHIGNNAFQRCSNLTTISFADQLTSIGDYAFAGCIALEQLRIPDSVTSIGSYALYNCTKLAQTYIGKGVTTFGQNVFYGATGEIEINSSLPSVEDNISSIFYGANFTKIVLGDAATTIGTYAIASCSKLTEVVLGSGITQLESCAIYDCPALTQVRPLAATPPAIYYYSAYKNNASLPTSNSLKIAVPAATFEAYTSYTSGKPGRTAPQNWYYFKSAITAE